MKIESFKNILWEQVNIMSKHTELMLDTLTDEEFESIPIVGEYEKITIQKYGYNFYHRRKNGDKEYNMYAIFPHLFRSKEPLPKSLVV